MAGDGAIRLSRSIPRIGDGERTLAASNFGVAVPPEQLKIPRATTRLHATWYFVQSAHGADIRLRARLH